MKLSEVVLLQNVEGSQKQVRYLLHRGRGLHQGGTLL